MILPHALLAFLMCYLCNRQFLWNFIMSCKNDKNLNSFNAKNTQRESVMQRKIKPIDCSAVIREGQFAEVLCSW